MVANSAPVTSPLRWLIGTELRRFRTEAGLTYPEASRLSGISQAKVNHLEIGRQQQDPTDIAALLRAYGAQLHEIDRLTSLTGRADEATWWAPWAAVVPDWLRTYVGLEGLADSAFAFQPMVIPGLLQTEAYARAITARAPSIRPDHGERFVGFRVARARRLTDAERPLELHAVITDAALRLAVGTAETRDEQLGHLLAVSELPSVTIQVVRPQDGPHSALGGGFISLDFGPVARPVVYIEHRDGAVYLQDTDQVAAYTLTASDLTQVAMGPEQSREWIASLLSS